MLVELEQPRQDLTVSLMEWEAETPRLWARYLPYCGKGHDQKQLGGGKSICHLTAWSSASREARAGTQSRNFMAGTEAETT